MPTVSIVIRAYNEEKQLRVLLESLKNQVFDGTAELVVVNNGSTDQTEKVAKEYEAKVVYLKQEEFSYPKSLNIGIEAASSPIVMCLVAHAFPDSPLWVANGLRHFRNQDVAGVFSYTKPYHNASIWDQLLWWPPIILTSLIGATRIRTVKPGMGIFGANNIALRRSVWERHQFDEKYGAAGEDSEWAEWAVSHGYSIIRDPGFAVRHSHNLRSFGDFRAQLRLWKRSNLARKFDRDELEFRGFLND
ncbi:MAG TPA: glycosyltransferase [Candidatus Saccharimonadia bacterium]|jgi:glycosyltransferase involved in cell wall biosynthesis